MAPRAPRRPTRDLPARIAVAVPAVAFALFIVARGGWVLAAGVALLGLVCLHELFGMYAETRPVKLAGFLGLIGLAVAARAGAERQVLLAFVAAFALVFLLSLAMPRTTTLGIAITLLGLA
jgi:phosphatidate cytidylyltransferase